MKFVKWGTKVPDEILNTEMKEGRGIGPVVLGETCFINKKITRAFYIPYTDISRFFRRVKSVPAKIGCCSGEMNMDYLVICRGEKEIAEIKLPDERAGKALFEEMKKRAPQAEAGTQKKESR